MKASDTILNKEQLNAINNSMPEDARYGDVFAEIAKQQVEISFKANMKAVGEWLEGQRVASEDFVPKGQNKYIITAKELADFKAGKMPED